MKPRSRKKDAQAAAQLSLFGGDAAAAAPVAEGFGSMPGRLAAWWQQGWLRRVDLEFARFLAAHAEAEQADASGQGAEDLGLVLLAAALCSWQLGRGHVCLDMAGVVRAPELLLALPPAAEPCRLLKTLDVRRWQRACDAWPLLVSDDSPGAAALAVPAGAAITPLVRADARLYLWRYRMHERQIQWAISQRLKLASAAGDGADEVLREGLALLFAQPADAAGARTDWQMVACALAARHGFGLITGGPGTGKTTTVVRLLALLQMQALRAQGRFLQIGLAAPTGKAAARLNSSINSAIARLPLGEMSDGERVRAAIPSSVQTLHRLLGSQRNTRHFRHHARNPLALDVLVIDEASMVDLEMMAMVVQALPDTARLIVLGDKDQLASVEAGAILGELCSRVQAGHYWPETMAWIRRVTGQQIPESLRDDRGGPLDQAIAMLRLSHRFRSDSGIGVLAALVNDGKAAEVRSLWLAQAQKAQAAQDIRKIPVTDDVRSNLRQLVVSGWGGANRPEGEAGEGIEQAVGYAHYLELMISARPAQDAGRDAFDAWAGRVLAAHGRFQLLAALRKGPWGVDQLNHQIGRWLQQQGLIAASEGWYAGRPVMVTQNDHELGLMNGDVGITLAGPGERLQVAFASDVAGAPVRWVTPSRLQTVETVFAMTVHKAQGSEFGHAALAMPEAVSPVLTRELVYTAITRARRHFTLCGPEPGLGKVFDEAIRRRVFRASGLMAGMSG